MHPFWILALAVASVFLLIVRLRINPFFALVLAATLIGVLTPNLPLGEVMSTVANRLGAVAGAIAIVIVMAAIVGDCLMESGGAEKIVRRFVAVIGEKRAALSLLVSGYVLAVPVFFDTIFYLLVPLARAMSVRTGGGNYVLNVLSISAGGSATHVFVPPTPGPMAMAATLGVDLGLVILVGLAVAIPSSAAGWLYARWVERRLGIPIREAPGLTIEELNVIASRSERELPPFWFSLLPIVLPILLITSNTVANAIGKESFFANIMRLLGNPNLALMISAVVALALLRSQKNHTLSQLGKTMERSIGSAGAIILITAAGGAFGAMLVRAGVGDALGTLGKALGMSHLAIAFLLAVMFKAAQGSGTVAMITVSSIMAPLVVTTPPDFHPVYVIMAIGAGSLVGVWMNDSGFWIYRTMTGLNEIESLQTKSAMMVVMGLAAMAATTFGSIILPLR
jgi:GntP family gluconate:H+ symporter